MNRLRSIWFLLDSGKLTHVPGPVRWGMIVVLWSLLVCAPAQAHRIGLGFCEVELVGDRAEWRLRLDADELGEFLHLEQTSQGRYEAEVFQTNLPTLERYLGERLILETDGLPCRDFELSNVEYDEQVVHTIEITATTRCPVPLGQVQIGDTILFDYSADYRHLAVIRTPHGTMETTFDGEQTRVTVWIGEPDIQVQGAGSDGAPVDRASFTETGPLARIVRFIVQGVEHIFIGFDHILFILGLTIVAPSLRKLVLVVTSFTVAHSITLALSSLDVVSVPSMVAESLIALSVALVGLENLVREPKRRWILAFTFGLIHGIGFSSVLRDLVGGSSLGTDVRLQLLFGFNLGVEIGQLAIVSAVYPVVALVRRKGHARKMVILFSAVILSFGLYWFVQRAFL